jgi:hypothetical protein
MQARERAVVQPKGRAPLDEPTLNAATLEFGIVEVRPGDRRTLRLTMWQCCVYGVDVPADVRFSMDRTSFATLDADTGYLQISPSAPAHTSFRVYADIEHGRRIVSADVWIDTPASNPLRGSWHETGDSCNPFGHPIESLQFRADGTFSVTWTPLEVYTDYWGFYTFDHPSGHISLGIRNGNYIPPVFAGDGQYTITEKDGGGHTLTLRGIYLGSRRGDTPNTIPGLLCSATFESDH